MAIWKGQLRCDMCHSPLKGARYQITTLLGPQDETLTVGPECYRKERKAREQAMARFTPAEIETLRKNIADRKAAEAGAA